MSQKIQRILEDFNGKRIIPCILVSLGFLFTAPQAQVRVLIFSETGPSGYIHPSCPKGQQYIGTLATLLGTTPAFTVTDLASTAAVGGGPSTPTNQATQNVTTLFQKLATTDVLVMNNNTALGGLFNASQKAAFLKFANAHGIIAMHGATDSHGLWDSWDSLSGGVFTKHDAVMATSNMDPPAISHPINAAMIKDGIAKQQMANDEYYSYQTSARKLPGVTVLWTIDETTYKPSAPMVDHPIAWVRDSPGGGRFFYTALGHRDSMFTTNAWTRHLLYNAILWAGGTPTAIKAGRAQLSNYVTVSPLHAGLTVAFLQEGSHSVQICGLDGKRVAGKSGSGKNAYSFAGLHPFSVYSVTTVTRKGRNSQLVTIQ
jgi:type 1 glutamine amidotransferase